MEMKCRYLPIKFEPEYTISSNKGRKYMFSAGYAAYLPDCRSARPLLLQPVIGVLISDLIIHS